MTRLRPAPGRAPPRPAGRNASVVCLGSWRRLRGMARGTEGYSDWWEQPTRILVAGNSILEKSRSAFEKGDVRSGCPRFVHPRTRHGGQSVGTPKGRCSGGAVLRRYPDPASRGCVGDPMPRRLKRPMVAALACRGCRPGVVAAPLHHRGPAPWNTTPPTLDIANHSGLNRAMPPCEACPGFEPV